jgi:hypothetical protein
MYGDQVCDDQITVCTAQGRLTFPEIQNHVIDFSTRRMTRRVLCDLSRATVADLTAGEIEEIIKLISRQVAGRSGGKAAIIARAGVDYGLARMFGTFAEIADLPIKVRVFRTPEIATQWLQEPPGS